jgi:tRNA(Ile)-lysidine synthase
MDGVRKFLSEHRSSEGPLLLGYSGGPDSKALLYALLEVGCGPLHVAHVDHGWREESARETEILRTEIAALGLQFLTTRLLPSAKGNKEERAREQRMAYFRSLFEKTPYQALLLGHQADDLAETSLKRLFEGAHLPFLGGMEDSSQMGDIPIWRPLLKTRRKEILLFLEKRGLKPFYDPTNRDPLYLRARMREETLPLLNRSFGKEVVENLICLSERAHELKRYLDRKIASCLIKRGEWGFAVLCRGLERIEQRHLLQKAAAEEGMILPRTVLEPVLDWLEEGRPGRKIFFQLRWITNDREWVFFLNSDAGKALPEKGLVRKLIISFI